MVPAGGGVEPGESDEQAAIRELREETGLRVADVGPPVGDRRAAFRFDGDQIDQYEVYFSIKVDRFPLDDSAWTPLERRSVLDHHWWSVEELRRTDETVYPERVLEWLGHAEQVCSSAGGITHLRPMGRNGQGPEVVKVRRSCRR